MKRFIILIFYCFCGNKNFAQDTIQLNDSSRYKIVTGFFLEYRDTIPVTDPDVTLCRNCYYKFFSPFLNDTILQKFSKKNSTNFNFIAIGEPYGFQIIADDEEAEKFYKPLNERFGFAILNKYSIFTNIGIPAFLPISNEKYLNVYYGSLKVVKTILLTRNGFNGQLSPTHIYVPDANNKIDYLFSIAFPR